MTPSQILLTVKACVLLTLLGFAYYLGGASGRVHLAQQKAKAEQVIAAMAKAETALQGKYRQAEQAKAAELAQVADQYEQDKRTNESKHNDLVAGLRAGNVKLHQRWQAALATGELSRTAASAAESDAAAADREGSAARIIAAADQCDAQIRGLQEVVKADRQ